MSADPPADDTRPFLRDLPRRAPSGRTLADALAEEPLPPLPWAVWIARQAAAQLDDAHRMGVLPGRVSLRSFSLVEGPGGEEVVLDVDLAATPIPSPEARSRVFPRPPLSTASDLWSLGAITYQLLSGAPPPYDPTGEPVPPPSRPNQRIPDAVAGVVRRLLDHSPHARPPADEVVLALSRAERELAATGERGLSWERGSLMQERWRLVRRLGGSMFLALDERDGRRAWAGPVLPLPDEPQRRAQLSRVLERLRERLDELAHPALPRIVDVVRTDEGGLGWVQEASEGVRLGDVPRFAPRQALEVVRALAEALAALHSRGLAGLRLGSGDVIVTAAGAVALTGVVADLVEAAALEHDSGVGRLVCGASHAPEVLQGARRGERSDRFLLGALAFWAATGTPPYHRADGFPAYLRSVVEQPATRARAVRPDVPPLLDDLIDRLLSKDPAARPTASAVVEALSR